MSDKATLDRHDDSPMIAVLSKLRVADEDEDESLSRPASHASHDEQKYIPSQSAQDKPSLVTSSLQTNAPITKLPFDLLSLVFRLACKDGDIFNTGAAFQISHVCQLFRYTAIETTSLWTCLDLEEGPPFERSKVQIARAKDTPVDVFIYGTFWRHGSEGLIQAFKTFLPPSRWGSFHLEGARKYMYRHDHHVHSALLSCQSPAPYLRKLELLRIGGYDSHGVTVFIPGESPLPTPYPPLDMFEDNAPRVQDVYLWGLSLDWRSPLLSGLKSLKLWHPVKAPSLDDWVHILGSSPSLEELGLVWCQPEREEAQPHAPLPMVAIILLPKLRQLHAGGLRPAALDFLFRTLDMPALQTLCLSELYALQHFHGALRNVTSARYPLLISLKLMGLETWIPKAKAIDFFRQLPSVEELEVRVQDDLVQAMVWFDRNHLAKDLILPNLQRLLTKGHNSTQLVAFLRQRMAVGNNKLKEVLIDWHDDSILSPVHKDYLESVAKLGHFHAFFPGIEDDDEGDDDDDEENGPDPNIPPISIFTRNRQFM